MSRYQQAEYWNMQFRAEYYTWCALRGHALPGNDPVHGNSRSKVWNQTREQTKHESKAAYIAMARYWISQAAQYRQSIR